MLYIYISDKQNLYKKRNKMPIKSIKRACFDKSSKQANKQYRITKY